MQSRRCVRVSSFDFRRSWPFHISTIVSLCCILTIPKGLVDKDGLDAFRKEIITLSKIDHINLITFVGYCLEPNLLIVMDFVSGGTLSAFVKAQDPADPPSLQVAMEILSGTARGLEYLHARQPMPILHRDIKSENILLTDKLEPRIADFGEARTMVRDHGMTIVCFDVNCITVGLKTRKNEVLYSRIRTRTCAHNHRLEQMVTPHPKYSRASTTARQRTYFLLLSS